MKKDYGIDILQTLCGEKFIYEWDSSIMDVQNFGIYNTTRKEVRFIFDDKGFTEEVVRNTFSGFSRIHGLQIESDAEIVEISIRSSNESLRTIHRTGLWLSYEWWKIKMAILHGIRKKLLFCEK